MMPVMTRPEVPYDDDAAMDDNSVLGWVSHRLARGRSRILKDFGTITWAPPEEDDD